MQERLNHRPVLVGVAGDPRFVFNDRLEKLLGILLLDEIFYALAKLTAVLKSWRQHYNTRRPHASLGYKLPAPATIMPPSNVAVNPTMH
ncbi:MAG: hypothetical protein B7Z40_17120 [Bosea sp. 12-68-7]|nr:MAG: hypothetical protein B7Z40_17120 [Bosea sp. 12-68-7]OYX01697.1 MAG: hypothetical protein B7Z14_05410 [Bosea sp. 32-68-6]